MGAFYVAGLNVKKWGNFERIIYLKKGVDELPLCESRRPAANYFFKQWRMIFSYIWNKHDNKVMAQIISIEYPDYLANSMRLNKEDFGKEVKLSALVKLFELGKVSSGIAAKVLNISRIEFLELLSKYNVSFLHSDDLAQDIENA